MKTDIQFSAYSRLGFLQMSVVKMCMIYYDAEENAKSV